MSKGRGGPRRRNLRPPIRPRERTSNSTALHQEERRGEHFPHWEFSRVAGSHELKLTAQCIADIADPITRIRELSTSRQRELYTTLAPTPFRTGHPVQIRTPTTTPIIAMVRDATATMVFRRVCVLWFPWLRCSASPIFS